MKRKAEIPLTRKSGTGCVAIILRIQIRASPSNDNPLPEKRNSRTFVRPFLDNAQENNRPTAVGTTRRNATVNNCQAAVEGCITLMGHEIEKNCEKFSVGWTCYKWRRNHQDSLPWIKLEIRAACRDAIMQETRWNSKWNATRRNGERERERERKQESRETRSKEIFRKGIYQTIRGTLRSGRSTLSKKPTGILNGMQPVKRRERRENF